jgi:hypothetical protein
VVLSRKKCHRHQHAQEATVKCHATFPNSKQPQRIAHKTVESVKKGIAQPASDHDADRSIKNEVINLMSLEWRMGLARPMTR